MNRNKYKEIIQEYSLVVQQISKKQEKLLLQQLPYIFVDNPITDFYYQGVNKHLLISDNFEIPNYEVMISPNGYISITDGQGAIWYQVSTESSVQLPYVTTVFDFEWSEIDVASIISGFTSEVDLHRFIELLEVEVALLKERLWLLKNGSLKLQLIEDEKLVQELTSLGEVA